MLWSEGPMIVGTTVLEERPEAYWTGLYWPDGSRVMKIPRRKQIGFYRLRERYDEDAQA